MRKFVAKLVFILSCTISIILFSCEQESEIDVEEEVVQVPTTEIDQISTIPIKGIKFAPSSELPNEFKTQAINWINKEKPVEAGKVPAREILSTYFEPNASIIESNSGIITYSLPINKLRTLASSKNIISQKQATNDECHDSDPFQTLVINFGSGGTNNNGMTHVSIVPGSKIGTFYVTFTNTITGVSETTVTTINSSGSTSIGSGISAIGSGLGSIATTIWRGIKSFFGKLFNLFKAKKCRCSNVRGSLSVGSAYVHLNSSISEECCTDSSSSNSISTSSIGANSVFDSIAFEYYFPVPDYLFEKKSGSTKNLATSSTNDALDCCALKSIDTNTADEAVKRDMFKCACANDDPSGVVNYLNLSSKTSFWLSNPDNKTFRETVCAFVVENNFSNEATSFAEAAVVAKEKGGEVDFEDRLINELTGKAKCVYDKLENLDLFRKTIKKFDDIESYNLILTTKGSCIGGGSGCTNFDERTNTATIKIIDTKQPSLDLAATILHEGIHADIYKFVSQHEKGKVNPNDRPRLMQLYFYYKKLADSKVIDPRHFNTIYQHEHMAEKYIKPIAQAIRQLDGNRFNIDHYYWFAWEGLEKTYLFKSKLTESKKKEYKRTKSRVNDTTNFKCN